MTNLRKDYNPVEIERLGMIVREAWVEWARKQPNPKPSWLVPWIELDEESKEADRCIGLAVAHSIHNMETQLLDTVERMAENNKTLQRFKELHSLAREAIIARGFFKPGQVGDDLAPRITEMFMALHEEIARLKRGDFTPEEFQNLCHHRDEKNGCTIQDFFDGCHEYQRKLYGRSERDILERRALADPLQPGRIGP